MPSILLIDGNEEIQMVNQDYLTRQGFEVICVNEGVKALAFLEEKHCDCIVLDVLLPDLDGFSICKAARTITDAPILFLSGLDGIENKVKGLMAGGDDYMTKPYSLKELAARIAVMLRRGNGSGRPGGDFYIDRENKIIHVLGKNVLLSGREFDLFLLFYENPKMVLSKEDILEKIWYGNAEIGVVAVIVLKLRRKFKFAEDVVGIIESSYGMGYRLVPPDI